MALHASQIFHPYDVLPNIFHSDELDNNNFHDGFYHVPVLVHHHGNLRLLYNHYLLVNNVHIGHFDIDHNNVLYHQHFDINIDD